MTVHLAQANAVGYRKGEKTMNQPLARDILVKAGNPEALDRTVQHFGAAVVGGGMPGGYVKVDGAYVVRCFGDIGFLKFAITNQGYGEVVKEFEGLYSDYYPETKPEGDDDGI